MGKSLGLATLLDNTNKGNLLWKLTVKYNDRSIITWIKEHICIE